MLNEMKSSSAGTENSVEKNENDVQSNSSALATQGEALRGSQAQKSTHNSRFTFLNNPKLKKVLLVLFFIFLTILVLILVKHFIDQKRLSSITDYESCAAAGYPIMESYPQQCARPDGKSFTRILSEEELKNLYANSTSDWVTYTNAKYGINFKRPPGWSLVEKEISDDSSRKLLISMNLLETQPSQNQYYIDIYNSDIENTEEFIKETYGITEQGPSNITRINLNDKETYKFFIAKSGVSPSGTGNILIRNGSTIVVISSAPKAGTAKEILNHVDLNNIASSLNFTQ